MKKKDCLYVSNPGRKKKKVLMFEVVFIDNPEIEFLVRGLINCLNTSTSKVFEL